MVEKICFELQDKRKKPIYTMSIISLITTAKSKHCYNDNKKVAIAIGFYLKNMYGFI